MSKTIKTIKTHFGETFSVLKDGQIGYKVVDALRPKRVRSITFREFIWKKGTNTAWARKEFKNLFNGQYSYDGYIYAYAKKSEALRHLSTDPNFAVIKVVLSKNCHARTFQGVFRNYPLFCAKVAEWDGNFIKTNK